MAGLASSCGSLGSATACAARRKPPSTQVWQRHDPSRPFCHVAHDGPNLKVNLGIDVRNRRAARFGQPCALLRSGTASCPRIESVSKPCHLRWSVAACMEMSFVMVSLSPVVSAGPRQLAECHLSQSSFISSHRPDDSPVFLCTLLEIAQCLVALRSFVLYFLSRHLCRHRPLVVMSLQNLAGRRAGGPWHKSNVLAALRFCRHVQIASTCLQTVWQDGRSEGETAQAGCQVLRRVGAGERILSLLSEACACGKNKKEDIL